MKIEEDIIILKDNRQIEIRSPKEEEADVVLNYFKTVCSESEFLTSYPEEVDENIEKEKEFLKGVNESNKSFWCSAYDGTKMVGNCSIREIGNRYKLNHRAGLGIAIRKEYCGVGLGRILMNKAIQKAKELGYTQVELGVYEDNNKAQALYKKLGFVETGVLPRAFRLKDGSYRDEINMVLFLD